MDSSILEFTQKYEEDTRIKSIEAFPYLPITGTQYNTPSVIRIDIESQDEFFWPHLSWLQIEGRILREDDHAYADEAVSITNNGLMYLFSNIKYLLSGNDVENMNHCGQGSTMFGHARYSKNYASGPGLAQAWFPDTNTHAADTNLGWLKRKQYFIRSTDTGHDDSGYFNVPLYLDGLFGIAEDYDKVMYGMRQSLYLTRKATDHDAIFRDNNAPAGKIVLSKITWWMPRVIPSEAESYKLYKQINDKITISCAYRMRQCASINISNVQNYTWNLGVRMASEKPRYVIVGFQSGKSGSQVANASLFDHCRVVNMKVRLNSTEYPSTDFNTDFTRNNYACFYQAMLNFVRQYNGVERLVSSTGIDAQDYKNLFPLYFFDVTRQSERLNQGVVDISVIINFAVNTPQNTYAYALVISDRVIKFQSDGRKMSIIS